MAPDTAATGPAQSQAPINQPVVTQQDDSKVRVEVNLDYCTVLFVLTHEGLIVDVTQDGEVVGTSSEMYTEIEERLTNGT